MDDELDVAIRPFHFPDGKPCITAVLSLYASGRSACRRFQRGHNTPARQFVACGMCRSLGVSGLGRHPEPDTSSRGRVCAWPGLRGQRPGMGIACASTRHRRRIAISFNSRRRATQYYGYSRARFSRYPSRQSAGTFCVRSKRCRFLVGLHGDSRSAKNWLRLGPDVDKFRSFDCTFGSLRRADPKCAKHPSSKCDLQLLSSYRR